jgi:probable HAF family extracellular repeat protein
MQVVGDSYVSTEARDAAALWDVTADGQVLDLTDISPAGAQAGRADRVNDLGFALVNRTFVYVPAVGLLTLPGFGGGNGSFGPLDDLGNVFGSAPDADGVKHPAMWHVEPSGQITGPVDLGDMGDFQVFDINNNGVMAGYVNPDAAIAWFDEFGQLQVQNLGALGPGDVAHAVAINDNGMVAGNSRDLSGYEEAFVWTPETGMVGLGNLGGPGSTATDVNNLGQIVGWSRSDGRFPQVAFVWQDGRMLDLNDITDGAGGKNWIQIASGMNDAGHIVGVLRKTKPVSEYHGFLLVPNVP